MALGEHKIFCVEQGQRQLPFHDSATYAAAVASMPSVTMIIVTVDDLKQLNILMALDGTFWAVSLAVHDIREMHCTKNANGEVILSRLTKHSGVEQEEDKEEEMEAGEENIVIVKYQVGEFLAAV